MFHNEETNPIRQKPRPEQNGTKVLPEIVSIEMTKVEARLMIGALTKRADEDHERARLLIRHIGQTHIGKYHPNREMARSFDNEAERFTALVSRIEGQL